MLNEGKRFRHLDLGIFLTPDPLEYVDGFNPYIYCNQNPWGRWDPIGLEWKVENYRNSPSVGFRANFGGNDKGNGIKGAWIAFSISSDTKLKSIKNKFIACEINFSYKNSQGESINSSILIARELTKEDVVKTKDGFEIKNMKIKGFAQDGGNIVEILKSMDLNNEDAGSNTQEISVSIRPGLFEGDIKDKKLNLKQSEIEFSDWDETNMGWNGSHKGQTKDMWSAYAQSQIEETKAYIPKENKHSSTKLENIKAKPLDIAPKHSKSQEIHDNY